MVVIRSRWIVCKITEMCSLRDSWNNNTSTRSRDVKDCWWSLWKSGWCYRLGRNGGGGAVSFRSKNWSSGRISWGQRKWPHASCSLWGHSVMAPLFTMPSKEAKLNLFEVSDHPAGSLKTCRCWTFVPLAESYSIFYPPIDVVGFEGETPRYDLCLMQLLRKKITKHLYFVSWVFWCESDVCWIFCSKK